MIKSEDFVRELKRNRINPVFQVPCSIFKDLINYLYETKDMEIINPVNEAVAMANAAGNYMSTQHIPLVMMQNSGLNNTLNALTSLNKQYRIPCVYLISWRGESKDAEEHNFMGAKLEDILKVYDVPAKVLTTGYAEEIEWASSLAQQLGHPTSLIMKKGFIEPCKRSTSEDVFPLSRMDSIGIVLDNAGDAAYISTNGFTSRQLHHLLQQRNKDDGRAFTMLGSMGHALGIGVEVARNTFNNIFVLDGDGGALMHLGSMASVAEHKPFNLTYVILDNQVYSSTGGQPTLSSNIDFRKIGEGFGFNVYRVDNKEELEDAIKKSISDDEPSMIHVRINKTEVPEKEMERIPYSCDEIRRRFESYLRKYK